MRDDSPSARAQLHVVDTRLEHSTAQTDAAISRVKNRTIVERGEHSPARQKRDAQITIGEAMGRGHTIEDLRAQLLQELETVNDAIGQMYAAPEQRARARRNKTQIETRLSAVEERRRPGVAYQDARTHYENAVSRLHETTETYAYESAAEQREDNLEQARFWRGQVELHGRRLAEEQVEHDMRAFDLDLYRRGLERKYAELAEREAEYEDDASELLEMAFLKQKMRTFALRMEEPKLQRRLHVERQRHVLARTAERTHHQITRLEKHRRTLNWLNPFHWTKIRDVDEQLTQLRHELEGVRMRSTLLTAPTAEEAVTPPMPPQSKAQSDEYPLQEINAIAAK